MDMIFPARKVSIVIKSFLFSAYLIFLLHIAIDVRFLLLNITTGLIVLFYIAANDSRRLFLNRFLILYLIIYFNIFLSFAFGINVRDMIFIFQLLCLYIVFYYYPLSDDGFLSFINVSYSIYLFFSLLVYYGEINPFNYGTEGTTNWFDLTNNVYYNYFVSKIGNMFFFLHDKTFVGADGSTSSIDSFSALVIVSNSLISKKKITKYIFVLIPFIILVSTFRLTPVVGIFAGLTFLIIPNKFKSIYSKLIIVFASTFWLLPYIFRDNHLVLFTLNSFTHSRASIWINYIDEILKSPVQNILFGMRGEIPFIQMGSLTFSQPHSSYLRMFLSFGGIMYLAFTSFLFYLSKRLKYNHRLGAVFITILVLAIVNNDILYNRNIVYIITVFFLFSRIENRKYIPI